MLPLLIRALLSDPACYDHPVEKVELVETHISWVVLTGDYAYKIKKPVNPGFLDFSTLALRHQDCIDELRLNRRLSAEYYLDVVAITGTPEAPRVGGSGEAHVNEVIEYAVKMRQFPVDATLDKLAERGELAHEQIDALAARLAHFHQFECERAAADSPWGEPEAIARPVEENFRILADRQENPAQSLLLADLQNWCVAEHARLAPLMAARKKNGRVRECHGDLYLANMAWADGRLLIFDCLEFSPGLRWIDVISEGAFCYMDLLHRKYEGFASRFLNAWLEATGDYQGVALLRYYAVYRALVRAKVASLRAGQVADSPAVQSARAEIAGYLQLAGQLAGIPSPFPLPPSLCITHGLSGSGKTALSQQMLEKHSMIRLRSDVERKRLAGLDASAREGEALGLYSESFGLRTYQHLAELAEGLLKADWPVIVDAAFLERWQRDLFRDLAQRLGAGFGILDIQADPATLRERVRRRQAEGGDASDADLRVLEHQLATTRSLDADELAVTIRSS
ncbi:MAG: AAA family ATPase [Gallionella sp.]|nr:AAA family ATPase [Gallionella sp.]